MTTSQLLNPRGLNHLFARLLVEELSRLGVSHFVLSPGSRSTPLALAVAERKDLHMVTHPDERGAAFLALGSAKATRQPVALICTSGTAVANYLPAVVEAAESCVPLLIISADRPFELHNTRANQTIKQAGIFSHFVRDTLDLPPPTSPTVFPLLISKIDHLIYTATRPPAGPVHLNCQFRAPLISPAPEKIDATTLNFPPLWWDSRSPLTCYTGLSSDRSPTLVQLPAAIAKLITSAKRGVILCGELSSERECAAAVDLAKYLGWPLIAEALSGLRTAQVANNESVHLISCGDLIFRSAAAREALAFDTALLLGDTPISASTLKYLDEASGATIQVLPHPRLADPQGCVRHRVESSLTSFVELLMRNLEKPNPSELGESARLLDRATTKLLEELSQDREEQCSAAELTEWITLRDVVALSPSQRIFYLANSLPVRTCNSFVPTSRHDHRFVGHRGASGIDGTIAQALGWCWGARQPTSLIIGDLATLHDLNSLLLLRSLPPAASAPCTIIILNNDGGGIFSFLPTITELPCFEQIFATPHGLTFAAAAAQFGIDYYSPATRTEFKSAYQEALATQRHSIIEVRTERSATVTAQRDVEAQALATIEAILQSL